MMTFDKRKFLEEFNNTYNKDKESGIFSLFRESRVSEYNNIREIITNAADDVGSRTARLLLLSSSLEEIVLFFDITVEEFKKKYKEDCENGMALLPLCRPRTSKVATINDIVKLAQENLLSRTAYVLLQLLYEGYEKKSQSLNRPQVRTTSF